MSDTIIRSLGAVFHNNKIYGVTHKVSVMAMEHAYEVLSAFLAEHGRLKLALTPDAILVNDVPCDIRGGLAHTVANALQKWEVNDLTLETGLTPDEFIRMIQLFERTPEKLLVAGDFSQLLGGAGIGHVRSRNVTLVEVAEEEVVINRDDVADGAAAGGASEADERTARGKRLMAFMGGESADAGDVVGDMKSAAASPAELGHLIVHTAHQVLVGAPPATDTRLAADAADSLVARIVESLKRVFEALKQDPSAQTQKGKKDLSRTLAEIEHELQAVLESLVANVSELNMIPISVAIEEMTEDLMVDALTTEYLKKRRLIETSEQRLKRYLARKGDFGDLDAIKARLMEGGLDEAGWQDLLVQSGHATAPTPAAGPQAQPRAVSADIASADMPTPVTAARAPSQPGATATPPELQSVLDELVGAFTVAISTSDASGQEDVRKLVDIVQKQIRAVVLEAERRLHRMEQLASGAMDDPNEAPEIDRARKLSRRQIIELLAEIVQEISQPLAVLSCAFQVIQPAIAKLGEPERDMLQLAIESTDRMDCLIKMLGRIAGPPSSLTPQALDIS
jgi:hypothetical protein